MCPPFFATILYYFVLKMYYFSTFVTTLAHSYPHGKKYKWLFTILFNRHGDADGKTHLGNFTSTIMTGTLHFSNES